MTGWLRPLAGAMLAAGALLAQAQEGTQAKTQTQQTQTQTHTQQAQAQVKTSSLPEGPGVDLVYANCRTCHSLQYVIDGKGLLPAQWQAVLQGMEDYGLEIGKPQHDEILDYLVTYLGPHPPPRAAAPPQEQVASQVDGATVYAQNCAACHGTEGRGVPDYYPPLAGNPDLARAREFPVLVVLHGLSGQIAVNGKRYNGSMPSFAHLSDAKVAALVNHLRGAWGNGNAASGIAPVTSDVVAKLRERNLGPDEVHAVREEMQ